MELTGEHKPCINLSARIKITDLVTEGVRNLWDGIRTNLFIKNLPGEIWVEAKDCFGIIQISNFMRVKNIRTNKPFILTQKINADGYWQIRFTHNNKRIGKRVHRIYALAFMQNPNKKAFINHKNLIKSDNIPLNLEWATEEENTLHAKINGAIPLGEKVKHSKLTTSQVIEIYNSILPHSKIQKLFGINKRMIYKIKSGLSWSSVTGGLPNLNPNRYSNEIVIKLYKDKRSVSDLSKEYKIPINVIYRIKKKQTYKKLLNGLDS